MAKVVFTLAKYYVVLSRDLEMDGFKFSAMIVCKSSNAEYTLINYFVSPDSPFVPVNKYDPATKTGRAYLPAERYSWYIDLLRNEEPINVTVDKDHPEWNGISTGLEPPGEEEG